MVRPIILCSQLWSSRCRHVPPPRDRSLGRHLVPKVVTPVLRRTFSAQWHGLDILRRRAGCSRANTGVERCAHEAHAVAAGETRVSDCLFGNVLFLCDSALVGFMTDWEQGPTATWLRDGERHSTWPRPLAGQSHGELSVARGTWCWPNGLSRKGDEGGFEN